MHILLTYSKRSQLNHFPPTPRYFPYPQSPQVCGLNPVYTSCLTNLTMYQLQVVLYPLCSHTDHNGEVQIRLHASCLNMAHPSIFCCFSSCSAREYLSSLALRCFSLFCAGEGKVEEEKVEGGKREIGSEKGKMGVAHLHFCLLLTFPTNIIFSWKIPFAFF